MPVLNDLDLGPSNPWKIPKSGIHTGVVEIPGGYAIPYGIDSTHPSWRLIFKYQARNAVGQYAALSQNAMEQLGRQLEELSRNLDLQPVYIQLFAGTGLAGGAINQPQDGWYYITSCEINYTEPFTGVGTVTLDVEYVSPGPPRRLGIWYSGGALSSTYVGAAVPWVAFPLNGFLSNTTRTGGEGAVPLYTSPPVQPQPFNLSSTIGDWFKCGCRVYDSMSAGGNAVPGAPTFLNTNWIEVKGADHRFVGDVIITNGLILWVLNVGSANVAVGYLWNMALGTPGWQQFCSLLYNDSTHAAATLRQISLTRVGMEEVALTTQSSLAATGSVGLVGLRLQRGAYTTRVEFRPQSQANSVVDGLALQAVANQKIAYNESFAYDIAQTGSGNVGASATYGYGASFVNNASYSFIMGWLYQNAPAGQPSVNGTNMVQFGDSSGPAANATRTYGIFAIPFASIANLQAEAEGGTLSGGFVSVADAGASGGNVAKLPNTTVIGGVDLFGTAWNPPVANYQCWVRMRTTTGTSGVSQMQLGIWDSTSSAWAVSSTLAPNVVATNYTNASNGWYKVGAIFVPGADNYRFRAANTATCTDDWWIDEAILVPLAGGGPYFPQDEFSQFIDERSRKWVLA